MSVFDCGWPLPHSDVDVFFSPLPSLTHSYILTSVLNFFVCILVAITTMWVWRVCQNEMMSYFSVLGRPESCDGNELPLNAISTVACLVIEFFLVGATWTFPLSFPSLPFPLCFSFIQGVDLGHLTCFCPTVPDHGVGGLKCSPFQNPRL